MRKIGYEYWLKINYVFSGIFLSDLNEIPALKIGNKIFELEIGSPTPELQEVAKKELKETPEVQKEATARLRELLKGSLYIN